MYTVNPSYTKIPSKENLTVKINYFLKSLNEDLTKHKFKFECFVLEEGQNQNIELKELFKKIEDRPERHLLIYSISRNVILEKAEKQENELLKLQSNNFQNDLNRMNETYHLQVN